eukprot:4822487-Amphidinium_carterae.1
MAAYPGRRAASSDSRPQMLAIGRELISCPTSGPSAVVTFSRRELSGVKDKSSSPVKGCKTPLLQTHLPSSTLYCDEFHCSKRCSSKYFKMLAHIEVEDLPQTVMKVKTCKLELSCNVYGSKNQQNTLHKSDA